MESKLLELHGTIGWSHDERMQARTSENASMRPLSDTGVFWLMEIWQIHLLPLH